MAVPHRLRWNDRGTEMFAPFLMEVKEHGACFSLSTWVPDKTVFVGNSQERRCAPPRANTNGIWAAREPQRSQSHTYHQLFRHVICW